MSRNWQKATALMAILTLSLVISGCDLFGSSPAPTPGPTAIVSGTPTKSANANATSTGGSAMATTPAMVITPTSATGGKTLKVGVIETVNQPALIAATQGVTMAFQEKGYSEGQNIHFDIKDGNLDPTNLAAIGAAFADPTAGYDAIIAVGTPATAAAMKAVADAGNKLPLFFVAVSDPYGSVPGTARFANSATDHADNITGIQDSPPVTDALKLLQEVLPKVKNVGLLWNPDESNSVYTRVIADRAAASLGFTIIEQPATKNVNLVEAANALADKQVEAFFVSTTNYVVTGLPGIAQAGADHNPKIPLFGNDFISATRGACLAYGLDYVDSGHKVGLMAWEALTGQQQVKNMPIQLQSKTALYVNTFYAQQQGVTIPASVLSQAAQVLNGPAAAAATPTPKK